MRETIIYLVIAIVLTALAHIYSAIKSGCFYAATNIENKEVHKKIFPYFENLHRVQTPFWYSLFGALFFLLFAICRIKQDSNILQALLDYSYFKAFFICLLITMGTSSSVGFIYQGYINIGSGLPFIDMNEKSKFELAFGKKSIWIPKFWHGKNRVYVSVLGFFSILLGILLIFKI